MKDGIYIGQYIYLKDGNSFYEWHFDCGWHRVDYLEDEIDGEFLQDGSLDSYVTYDIGSY